MTPLMTMALALSMSADAFAAALGKGAGLDRLRLREVLRAALIFGVIEAMTPVIGWTAGVAAAGYIIAVDHWIAFVLLAAIGAKMIWEAARPSDACEKPQRHSLGVLVATAIGTSIDAMVVGVTLALINASIIAAALAIGAATFAMTGLGIVIGGLSGAKFGRIAEMAGGVALILIGVKILAQHTLGAGP